MSPIEQTDRSSSNSSSLTKPAPPHAAQSEAAPRSRLEEFEREGDNKPPYYLTRTEIKLLGITGIGFFLDAYDLFIINPVTTMLQYRLYGGQHLPADLEGLVKAGANIGSVIGQFLFGYLADAFGRKAIYGKELMLIIIATILTLTTPTGSLSPDHALIYLACFRILLGIGVGGDYPMSASVTSDRASLRKRGTMLAYIFANQGWGSFAGSLATIAVLAAYRGAIEGKGQISKTDGVWRVVVGISLIPAFGTLYQRLTLPEATRFSEARAKAMQNEEDDITELKKKQEREDVERAMKDGEVSQEKMEYPPSPQEKPPAVIAKEKGHFREFIRYFSQWKHAKILIGTAGCWFLLDIAFYGINLNQNVVLQQIGFDGKDGTPWHRLFRIATGNMIITALGFVPGYYATILTIERFGRKKIQLMGFLMEALFLAILAGKFHSLKTAPFIVVFALLQFFFNFGANTTTYVYPAEVFPTRFKALAHGTSAAAGKAGAIISALAFNRLSKSVGTPAVLWIFVGCCLAGAVLTLLLPEVKGRDADRLYEEELEAARRAA